MMLNNQTIIMLKFKKRKKNVFVDLDILSFLKVIIIRGIYKKYKDF